MSAPMINVTLPDGTVLEVPPDSSIGDVAAAIGPGLAKAAVAGQIDGETVDLGTPLAGDAAVRILTERDEDALAVLRHSAAHVLATAVRDAAVQRVVPRVPAREREAAFASEGLRTPRGACGARAGVAV